MNAVLLIIVIFWDRSSLGFGTVFNMVLVGYYVDFFRWVWARTLEDSLFTEAATRWPIFLVCLLLFMLSAAVYINADTGVAPYDGIPIILTDAITSKFKKIPKASVRIAWDGAAIVIGILFGSTPVVGTILMALFLGPLITAVGRVLFRKRKEA